MKGEMNMKKIIKMGIGVTLIYSVAIICTFVMADRVERLEASLLFLKNSIKRFFIGML